MKLNELMAAVVVVVGICGCQYTHVNRQENENARPYKDIFDFRKEMRLTYIEMCKQESQREHGDNQGWAADCLRETGKVLKAADLIPERRRAEVRSALVDGVAKKLGGKKNLLSEPKIIDNCYLAKDGIHFVYNEYEVAPYAEGPVDAVVQVPTDSSRPVSVARVTTRPIY